MNWAASRLAARRLLPGSVRFCYTSFIYPTPVMRISFQAHGVVFLLAVLIVFIVPFPIGLFFFFLVIFIKL